MHGLIFIKYYMKSQDLLVQFTRIVIFRLQQFYFFFPVWFFQTGSCGGQEGRPLPSDGTCCQANINGVKKENFLLKLN